MINIREMHVDDAPTVFLIDTMSNPLPWSLRAYLTETRKPYTSVWVAEGPTEVPVRYENLSGSGDTSLTAAAGSTALFGFIVIWFIFYEAHIANFAVHPDFRRRGIGKALLEHVLRYARENGMDSATLEVRASNRAARQLYQSLGFEEVGLRKKYYNNNREDAIIMTLSSLKAKES